MTTADDDGAGEEESPCFSGGACSPSRRFQVRYYVRCPWPCGSTSGQLCRHRMISRLFYRPGSDKDNFVFCLFSFEGDVKEYYTKCKVWPPRHVIRLSYTPILILTGKLLVQELPSIYFFTLINLPLVFSPTFSFLLY